MKAIGLDIGTTTLSAVVLDTDSGELVETRNIPSGADLAPGVQDAEMIRRKALALIAELKKKHRPDCVGLDGQMHGIVYLNARGEAVSPLYTWQNPMGDASAGEGAGETYAHRLARLTGHRAATGFGAVTHYVLTRQGRIPPDAARFCAIHDWLGMCLTGRETPLTHVSDAASFGLFDLDAACFDAPALQKAGLDAAFFPEVTEKAALLGVDADGLPVACAIGDSQAAFLGSVAGPGAAAVNMGTGGQISLQANVTGENFERRPLGDGEFIVSGSSLCGGRAYALLEGFLRSCAALSGRECEPGSLYAVMNALAEKALESENDLRFTPLFCGTRQRPELRASMEGANAQNFNAAHLCGAFVEGMARELCDVYAQMRAAGAPAPRLLVGSGNAIRRNPALKKAFERAFQMEMRIPAHQEEAAYGAALFAVSAVTKEAALSLSRRCVRYL